MSAWEGLEKELGATGVVSDSFKSRLFAIAGKIAEEARERGQGENAVNRELRAERDRIAAELAETNRSRNALASDRARYQTMHSLVRARLEDTIAEGAEVCERADELEAEVLELQTELERAIETGEGLLTALETEHARSRVTLHRLDRAEQEGGRLAGENVRLRARIASAQNACHGSVSVPVQWVLEALES